VEVQQLTIVSIAFHGVTELLKDDDDKASEFKRANVMKVKQLEGKYR